MILGVKLKSRTGACELIPDSRKEEKKCKQEIICQTFPHNSHAQGKSHTVHVLVYVHGMHISVGLWSYTKQNPKRLTFPIPTRTFVQLKYTASGLVSRFYDATDKPVIVSSTNVKLRVYTKHRGVDMCIRTAMASQFGLGKRPCIVHSQSALCTEGAITEPKVTL